MKQKSKFLCQGAVIAALYVVLTWLAALLGLSSGAVQVRFSEALCILPYFTPAAIPGLFIGCILANLLTGAVFWDVIFGSFATLLGASVAYFVRRFKWLVPLPTVLANMLIVPFVLRLAYGVPDAWWYLMLTVGAGEIISVYGFGMLLLFALDKRGWRIFG